MAKGKKSRACSGQSRRSLLNGSRLLERGYTVGWGGNSSSENEMGKAGQRVSLRRAILFCRQVSGIETFAWYLGITPK